MNTQTALPSGSAQRLRQSPWMHLVLGILIIFLPVALVQTFLLSLPFTPLVRGLLVAAFSVPVALGAYYVLVRFVERRELTELSLPGAARETACGVAIGAVFFGGILGVLALTGASSIVGWNSPGVLLAPLLFALSSAVFEEILFRGVLFRLLERGLGSWLALLISALLFGGLHLVNEHATVIGAVAIMLQAGIAMGAAFMLTRRLWLPIGMHFGWNFVQSGVFGSALSGNAAGQGLLRLAFTGPDWLTGGVFGVEASIVTVVLALIVGILFLRAARKKGNVIQGRGSAERQER